MNVPGLGARIRSARRADSRSLKAICQLVGMTRTNWYRIEAETQTLPIDTLRKIEQVLEVEFGVEFTDTPDVPSVQSPPNLLITRAYPSEIGRAAESNTPSYEMEPSESEED